MKLELEEEVKCIEEKFGYRQLDLYKEIFQTISEPHVMIEANQHFIFGNKAACLLLERDLEEVGTMKMSDFYTVPVRKETGTEKLHKEKKWLQLSSGFLKGIEFTNVGTLQESIKIYRLEELHNEIPEMQQTLMSRQMLWGISNSSSDPLLFFDHEERILEANHAFFQIFGLSKEDVSGKKVQDLLQGREQTWMKEVETGGRKVFEATITVKGNPFRVSASVMPASIHNVYLMMFERKEEAFLIEKRLETSEKIFAELFDQSMDAIIFWNDSGIIFRVNDSACRIFESSHEELIGSYVWKYIYRKNQHYTNMREEFERNGQVRGELFYKMPNDQIKLLELTAKKHEGEGYNVTIFRNVTERWQIEKELRRSERKFRKIFEGSLDGLILWNDEGFTDINIAGQQILEISKRNLLGLTVKEFIKRNPGNHVEDHVNKVYEQGVYSSIIPITFDDGRVKHLEFLTRGYLYSSQHLSIFRDVSKNLEMQEQIRKSDTLNVVGELAAGIAHEIRNPMTALKGFVQLLESGVKEDFSTYFQVITSEINRIETIITEFLVLAKPQALNYSKHNVHIILQETLELLAAQALMDNIQFKTVFEEEDITIYCEANQLKQVFINIVKNALEVMPGGGQVHIQTKRTDKYVCVSIQDQGMGISKDKLKRLGEPFYTTKERGTGLGLMVSYKIIEEHKGYIDVESEMNKGTCFHIYLPFER